MKYDNTRIIKSEKGFDGCIVWEVENTEHVDKYMYESFHIMDLDKGFYITEAMARALLQELPLYLAAVDNCYKIHKDAVKDKQ